MTEKDYEELFILSELLGPGRCDNNDIETKYFSIPIQDKADLELLLKDEPGEERE